MITFAEWYEIGGGESGYIAVRPDNPDIVYAGSMQGFLTRYDHGRGQRRHITVWPESYMGWGAKDMKYRFQWTSPTVLSPHNPNILLTGANVVFRSENEGQSWTPISDDLTRGDPETLEPKYRVIGVDNWDILAQASRPPLTSVDMQLQDLGRAAARALSTAIGGASNPGVNRLPVRVVPRESTAGV